MKTSKHSDSADSLAALASLIDIPGKKYIPIFPKPKSAELLKLAERARAAKLTELNRWAARPTQFTAKTIPKKRQKTLSMDTETYVSPTMPPQDPKFESVPKNKRVYLSKEELRYVLPRNKRVYRMESVDGAFSNYFLGMDPPEVEVKDLNAGQAYYWYDLALDQVKRWDTEKGAWKTDPYAPRYAADMQVKEVIGQVEDEEIPIVEVKSVSDLLSEDI